ncbi:MAG: MerR family transcriptional regulator [Ferruginibacter sp.]
MALEQSAFNFVPGKTSQGEKSLHAGVDAAPDAEQKPIQKNDSQGTMPEIVTGTDESAEILEIDFIVSDPASDLTNQEIKRRPRGRMKLSEMNAVADLIDVPADEDLFKKSYYSIGSVSRMFKVNISLIRFWENEFDILKPKKNGKGDRHFRPEDIKNLKLIYHLLREKKYTIEGAKEFLKKNKKADEKFEVIEALQKIKLFLNEFKANF